MRVFMLRRTMLFCICVFLIGNAHFALADSETEVEAFFAAPAGYSRLIDVPGKGPMRYYAQNDPLWGALCYEKHDVLSSRRPFRDSGCSPSSFAMAISELVPDDDLSHLASGAKRPFTLCPCSLNKSRCNKGHTRYYVTSTRDYVRFLPLLLGDYATGNNTEGVYSRAVSPGTNSVYLKYVAALYGLRTYTTTDLNEALAAIEQGHAVMALASAGGSFTDSGHYVLLASYVQDKLYVLDPLYRTVYKTKNASALEMIEPGLVAMTRENIRYAQFTNFYILQAAE